MLEWKTDRSKHIYRKSANHHTRCEGDSNSMFPSIRILSRRNINFIHRACFSTMSFYNEAVSTVYEEKNLKLKIENARNLSKSWKKRREAPLTIIHQKEDIELFKKLHNPNTWVAPARPPKPVLQERVPGHKELQIPIAAHIMHTLAHIELNAVDMYLDTVVRFGWSLSEDGTRLIQVVPEEFIDDLMSIVDDEARHFDMVYHRLNKMTEESQVKAGGEEVDVRYGSIPATTLLWNLGVNTRDSLASRLAVIPLSQEARGLDATPRFVQRLNSGNDHESASIVGLIGMEEVRHVALGFKWLAWEAVRLGRVVAPQNSVEAGEQEQKLGPQQVENLGEYWRELVSPHFPDGMFPPFNRIARCEAGMPESWYVPLCRSEPTFTDTTMINSQQGQINSEGQHGSIPSPEYVTRFVSKHSTTQT